MSDTKDKAVLLEETLSKESILELTVSDEGILHLRDMQDKDNPPLVSIDFSEKIKDILGNDIHMIGQHMINAAIQVIMNKQMNQWHANVYDDEPDHYS